MVISRKMIGIALIAFFMSVKAEGLHLPNACGMRDTCRNDTLPQELKPTRQYGFMGIGIAEAGLSRVNDKLAATGLSSYQKTGFNLGFGGHLEIRKLMLEGAISGLAWGDNVDQQFRTSLYAANMIGHIGVNLLPENMTVTLSPYAGMGLGINWLRIRKNRETLSEAIETSDPNVNIWQGTFLTQLGVALDFVFPSQDRRKGFVLGVRSGYQFAPVQTSWYSEDTPISDMPDMKQRGLFAKLILGGWQPHRHKHCCCENGRAH